MDNISKIFYSSKNKGQGQPWLKGLYNLVPQKLYKVEKNKN